MWLRVLLPLLAHPSAAGKEKMYAALAAWGVTDVAAMAALPGP
jgi:hypothetical protein